MDTNKARPVDDAISPEHYKFANGIETKYYIKAVCRKLEGDEAFCVANIIKYVSRYRRKDPRNCIRDLRKIEWYLNELIETVEEKNAQGDRAKLGEFV